MRSVFVLIERRGEAWREATSPRWSALRGPSPNQHNPELISSQVETPPRRGHPAQSQSTQRDPPAARLLPRV